MKRIFVAISITKKLQEVILSWQKTHQSLPVRWMIGKNLHVTLVPPWQEEKVEEVSEKIERLENKFSSFEMQFNLISFGPNLHEPRLIWATGPAPKEIVVLKDQ